jgi:HEPN domain-containing protein
MNNEEIIGHWLIRANNDLKTGKDELTTENPATDTICFHMQQCVEKYLKVFLVSKGKEVSKTHNIALIIQHCSDINTDFNILKNSSADELTMYAIGMRYPDDFYMPSLEETINAIRIAEHIKEFVLKKLNA